jgi:hypothetical protein
MWGIPRRHGYSDIEDPRAHSGIPQHAFPFDRNDRAICGFEPPKRSTWLNPVPQPQLALASPAYNPRCQDCLRLLVGRSQHAPDLGDLRPAVAIPIEADRPLVAIPLPAGLGHAGPVQPREAVEAVHAVQPAEEVETLAPVDTEVGQAQRRKSSRRSVRRGGTISVATGEPFVEIDAPEAAAGAGIVASVVHGPSGVRVASVTVHDDGRATIALNQPPTSPVNVAWFIVSAPEPQVVGTPQ